MNGRHRIACWSLVVTLAFVGCQGGADTATTAAEPKPAPPKAQAAPKAPNASAKSAKAKPADHRKTISKLPAPPGVEAQEIEPRSGEALIKARLPLQQVLSQLRKPAFLTESAPPTSVEVPRPAQRAYVAGRMAYRQNQFDDAQRHLHAALNLAPNQPQILRLLGQIYNRWNNKIRGAYYLEQAVRADPTDVESIFALGRHALEQGRWPDAIVTLWHCLDLLTKNADSADPAMQWLVRYYLGSALDRDGYDAASAEQLLSYLQSPQLVRRSSRMLQHLYLLDRQRQRLWVGVGDAFNRLDQPARAMECYQQAAQGDDAAAEHAATLGAELVSRRVYTLLRLNKQAEARREVIDYLRLVRTDPGALALVSYATTVGIDGKELCDQLQVLYGESDRPAALAVVVADLLPPPQRVAWLKQHLQAKPQDDAVLQRLVQVGLALEQNKFADAGAAAAVVDLAAEVLERAPRHAADYAIALSSQREVVDPLLALVDGLPTPQRQRQGIRFIRATLLIRQNKGEPAAQELRSLLEEQPDLQPARIQLAALLAAQDQFEEAGKVLEPLKDSTLPQVMALRIRILAETGHGPEALQLVNDLIARQPTNVDLIVDKAMLQFKTGDVAAAERTLWDAVNLRPEDERLYALLFEIYDSERNPLPDAAQQYQRLMRKMLGAIPHSRLARLKRAELAAARGDFDVAQELLRGVLNQNPRDTEALDELLEVMVSAGKRDEAEKLLQQRLDEQPGDRGVLAVAYKHYQERVEDKRRADQIGEQLLRLQPPSPRRDQELAKIYLRLDRPQDAIKVIEQALAGEVEDPTVLVGLHAEALVKQGKLPQAEAVFRTAVARYPQHEADLLFHWAVQVDKSGDRPRAERMFADLLAKHPDHPDANNHLGYTWADRNENLQQAKVMIEKALAAEPNSAAYLDSLGWVHYKLGSFAEAVRRLKQAVMAPYGDHPVILDHLGDALYRAGEQREAVQTWRRAQHYMSLPAYREADEPDMKGLGERLGAKVQAVMGKQVPAVAEAPGAGQVEPPRADAADGEAILENVPQVQVMPPPPAEAPPAEAPADAAP